MPLNYTAPPKRKAWWDNEYFQSLRELLGFAAAVVPDDQEEDDDAFAVDDSLTHYEMYGELLPQKRNKEDIF